MRRSGYTLVEAAIAMLLTAVIASSVFSLALTTKRGSAKGLRKLIADQGARQLADHLKYYIAASTDTSIIYGPQGSGINSYSFDQVQGIDDTSCANCYALDASIPTHTLTGFLPGWFESSPYFGRASYHVASHGTIGSIPVVTITVNWSEP